MPDNVVQSVSRSCSQTRPHARLKYRKVTSISSSASSPSQRYLKIGLQHSRHAWVMPHVAQVACPAAGLTAWGVCSLGTSPAPGWGGAARSPPHPDPQTSSHLEHKTLVSIQNITKVTHPLRLHPDSVKQLLMITQRRQQYLLWLLLPCGSSAVPVNIFPHFSAHLFTFLLSWNDDPNQWDALKFPQK